MGRSISKSMSLTEWCLLIILAVLWGGSFFFGKVALCELRPFTLVLLRVFIAAIALNLALLAGGHRMPLALKVWGLFLIMGLFNNLIPFSLIFWGQTRITSGLASILNATTPLWTVLLAHFLTPDEHLTLPRLVGVVFGLMGSVLTIGPEALSGLGLNVVAQLAVIGAGFSYAFAGIFGKRLKGISPYSAATGQLTCTTIMMIPLALWVDQPWLLDLPHAKTWAAVLGLALLSTCVAYVIYFRLLATAGATNLLLVTFLIPMSALMLGITILGERLDLRHFMGMGLMGAGLAAIDGRPWIVLTERIRKRTVRHSLAGDDYGI